MSLSSIRPPWPLPRTQLWLPARARPWQPGPVRLWATGPLQVRPSKRCFGRGTLDPRCLGGRPNDDVPAATARHGPLYEEQLALEVHAHDLETLRSALRGAKMPRHALAGKHASRILCHPGRTRFVVRNGVPVARAVGGKMVALDHPGEALALRHAGNVHLLSYLEDVCHELAAELEISELAFGYAEFAQYVTGLDRGLGEVAGGGLVDAGSATLAESDLHGAVAVGRGRLDLRHTVVGHVEHRHRQRVAVVGENAGHADLAADQS